MIALLRLAFAAATVAVIGFGGYYFIERNHAPAVPAAVTADISPESIEDTRKKARAAAKLAADKSCTELSADYEVWEDYLDKKTRRKLKALIDKCDNGADVQSSAEP